MIHIADTNFPGVQPTADEPIDPLGACRGIIAGLLCSAVLWAVLLGVVLGVGRWG